VNHSNTRCSTSQAIHFRSPGTGRFSQSILMLSSPWGG
jgi:hypothetical protein